MKDDKTVNPAQRMAAAKIKLIARLKQEIKYINAQAIRDTEKVEGRIRVAQTILDALKGDTKAVAS